jgi:cysteine desulfurase
VSHYLDHNATTRLLPEALEAMTRAAEAAWANPSSLHAPGRASRAVVETAREQVADLVGAAPHEIVFTGGGTEACAFGILGAARSWVLSKGRPGHVVATAFEHSAVKSAVASLEAEGWAITWVKPDADGIVRPEAVEAALRPDTALCVVMAAQNEVGTLQPIAEIGARLQDARARGALFFSDLTQALGKTPIDFAAPAWSAVDLAPLVAHKIGGPKGAGALFVRKGVRIEPLLRGGGQERALRGGTENVPGIAGFGAAAAWWRSHGDAERRRVAALRDALQGALRERIPDMRITAENAPRLPNTLHATFPGLRGDVLVMALDLRGIAVSAGSACASGSVKPSEALLAMGRAPEDAVSSLRFSLGLGNSGDEIIPVADAAAAACAQARAAT